MERRESVFILFPSSSSHPWVGGTARLRLLGPCNPAHKPQSLTQHFYLVLRWFCDLQSNIICVIYSLCFYNGAFKSEPLNSDSAFQSWTHHTVIFNDLSHVVFSSCCEVCVTSSTSVICCDITLFAWFDLSVHSVSRLNFTSLRIDF